MVRFELLALEALRRGYDQDPQVKLAQKQAMVSRFTAEEVSKLVQMKDISEEEIQTITTVIMLSSDVRPETELLTSGGR